MSIKVALTHVTHYRFDRPVELSPHVVRLRPAPHCRTPIAAYSLRVTPADHFINWQQDPFGNYQARLVFQKPTQELKVEVDLVADLTTINPFDFFLEEAAENAPLTYPTALGEELKPYLIAAAPGAKLAALIGHVADKIVRPGRRNIDVLVDINQLIQRTVHYDIRMEPGVFEPDETLGRGHGSCRDFAWLQVQLLRHLGYAARFVSGYSIQLKADEKPLEGPAGVSEDGTDLHAWAEVFLPGAGWVGLDATSGLLAGEGHIPLAATADPANAAAITGAFSWAKQKETDKLGEEFSHTMSVRRLEEPPRTTKPYSEEIWRDILACGDQVDQVLVAGDVRLTMGGEPTFVSIDDREGDEWNTAALGPTKGKIADELIRRLHKRFAAGGLLHHGQGKWYPGEPLPRWAYSCYFRRDGEPLWTDPALIADGKGAEKASAPEALVFSEALARRLGIDPAYLVPAYEDAYYYLWRERKLPLNVDPFEANLDNEMERARLRRVFEQGLRSVVGYALPLKADPVGDAAAKKIEWASGPWFFRGERMYLAPGDSPMGWRLPLDSLPWAKPEDRQEIPEPDPLAAREPLPPRKTLARPVIATQRPTTPAAVKAARVPTPVKPLTPVPVKGRSAKDLVKTALCCEPRGGTLHVFLPPMGSIEEFVDLIAAIEQTAAELRQPIRLEGYLPPSDPRLDRLQVTPDPGVIEVNVQPAHSWRELVANTTILYEEARQSRLGTEKFMLDGRHTGTGGGNHVVLGGATAADSPLLRRPDLLSSFVTYWLNHPSLSYLFSGLFIGPTSQAPRIDEARHDSLYELDIARALLATRGDGAPTPPWLVDRLFRHLLVDLTGNTHRTELCIDKLFSPDAASGRQGLLELRAFEMPPHARMSAAQALLVRSLCAWFWNQPYTRQPVRWGTSLVDRFMLPHYVSEDFAGVIDDLNRAGFPLERSWFDPHYEFRFPLCGKVVVADTEIELRQALEPWHVLGEEAAGGGNARYVDSSVERLQVFVRGALPDRHVVTCNGRRLPLSPTQTREDHVAGVRFRAWQPPNALHPTIGVHAPLVFDLLDTWAGRSLGGCTYHVVHPGGRSNEDFPANALAAESRRVARFFPNGHTPGNVPVPAAEPNPELPHTLDLRRSFPVRNPT
jgi:uncharacterized protein (DUF2126 family)/transglutaminase-like putative cysteine protease